MKKCRLFLAMTLAAVVFVSCSDDDNSNASLGNYDNGTFVLNEGNTTVTTSSITFIGDDGSIEQDVYRNVNPNAVGLGTYLQSMFFDDTRAFIISGQANKITVVNRYTFQYIATIDTNFENPRYGAVLNGKAYVTNYADFATGSDDFLTVIDLSNYATIKVNLNNWSEKIIAENGKLFIANGYYGNGSSVTVFNPNTNTGTAIEIGGSPNSFDEEDGILYVLDGQKITKIDLSTNQISGTPVILPENQQGAKNIFEENNKLYYTNGTKVYAMNKNATTASVSELFSYNSASGFGAMYGFAVEDNKIYIADADSFTANSNIFRYKLDGSFIDVIPVGVGPNGFYFN